MSYTANVLKVMIATPSDVPTERNAIRQALTHWNNANSEARKIVLMPVGWDTHSSPQMGARPQALINDQVLQGCDILIAAFWTKLGTPTGQHASGTVEEIEEYLKTGQHAMLYFSTAPVVPDSLDAKQYDDLKKFKESCKTRGLYASYSDSDEFSILLYQHLQLKLNSGEFMNSPAQTPTAQVEPNSTSVSDHARTLLKSAAEKDGMIMFIRYLEGAMIGPTGSNFVSDANPRTLARWESALKELEENGLIAASNPNRSSFRITNDGYLLVDRI